MRNIYKLLSVYWAFKAMKRGRLPQYEARKLIYRHTSRVARKIFKP